MGMFGSSSIEGWLQLQLSNQVDISLRVGGMRSGCQIELVGESAPD